MHIKLLKLNHFRNFKKREFEFSQNISVIIGPNASGKTNILEAIFLLSTGKSFKAKIEEEMVNYEAEVARVLGLIAKDKEKTEEKYPESRLEVILTRGEINIGTTQVERVPRKKMLVEGVSRRLLDFAGSLKVVPFGPQDLDLVSQAPTLRRRFLDMVLSQVDKEYRRACLSYEKGLKQRNRLLFRIREEGLSRSQLLFWDRLLVRNGDYLSFKRQRFIDFANASEGLNDQRFILEYDKSAISESRLEQYAAEEVAAATTLVGPHRDDFAFKIENQGKKQKKMRDLSRYGSRGEQRMSVLWLKLVELSFIETETAEKPVLLLDDIFSELDHEHRDIVFATAKGQQTIITTADPHNVASFKKVEKIQL